jgi:aminoglycoside phosphotransferase (APT) family kinase protein
LTADEATVRALLAKQFPQWASLELTRVASHGTDNVIFRLGADMAVRLPRVDYAAEMLVKEATWLPGLSHLPLEVPRVMGVGEPDAAFKAPWLVMRWLAGEPAPMTAPAGMQVGQVLGAFVAALQRLDASGGPEAGAQNMNRGAPLAVRDQRTREWIAVIGDRFDAGAPLAIWEAALAAPEHDGRGVWVHGDLHAGNLLMRDGGLSGVIDFGLLGVGDPAVDLTPAWCFLPAEEREDFRREAGADADMWTRGRGWAVSIAASQQAFYRGKNWFLEEMSSRTLRAVLAE